jgi:gag-polypeptide of LTR copia-type
MKKSLTNRLRLKLRLYTLRMEECTFISNHIAEFTSIFNDLDKLGVKIENSTKSFGCCVRYPHHTRLLGI